MPIDIFPSLAQQERSALIASMVACGATEQQASDYVGTLSDEQVRFLAADLPD